MAGSLTRGALLGCTHTPVPHSQLVSVPWAGSLWQPHITVDTLEAHQLQVNFTLWNESARYQILLESFPHTANQTCFKHVMDIPMVTFCHS